MADSGFGALSEQDRRVADKLKRELGQQICDFLEDPEVVEIMLNPDGSLWVEKARRPMERCGHMPASQGEAILTTIAAHYRETITRDRPILTRELPFYGTRLIGLIPPVVQGPTFAIRTKASTVLSLEDYAAAGMFKPGLKVEHAKATWMEERDPVALIRGAIAAKANTLIVGGTGSGKTTFANAILLGVAEKHSNDRLVVIEDTTELQVKVPNAVALRTSESVSMRDLLRATMRLRPTRIVVGEVRGGEAWALLKAWNTGHPGGLGTIHADSAAQGLEQLTKYVFEDPSAQALPSEIVRSTIASAVGLVVFIESLDCSPWRAITEICRVRGYGPGGFDLEPCSSAFVNPQ